VPKIKKGQNCENHSFPEERVFERRKEGKKERRKAGRKEGKKERRKEKRNEGKK
jgi:hypothetical protein